MCYDHKTMEAIVHESARVRLEPLGENHLAELRRTCNDPELWQFTFQPNPFHDDAAAIAWLAQAQHSENTQAFAIVDKVSGALAGSTRYLDICWEHRKVEIGWTFLSRPFWRSYVNTETKLLLLTYAFERWNALRVQLKAEAANARSREAILRLGACFEGTLRNFRLRPADSTVRDVSFYSVIAQEWPQVKRRLVTLLRSPFH